MNYEEVDWASANCAGTDYEAWFPVDHIEKWSAYLEPICAACHIKTGCLAWALENKESGYWGGQYFSWRNRGEDGESDEVHTAGDGDNVPDVWEGSAATVCAEGGSPNEHGVPPTQNAGQRCGVNERGE